MTVMAKFNKGIISKEQEVIIKRTMYTDGTINTVTMGKLVRCKDCKYYRCGNPFGFCEFLSMPFVSEGDYCRWAERKCDHHEKAD